MRNPDSKSIVVVGALVGGANVAGISGGFLFALFLVMLGGTIGGAFGFGMFGGTVGAIIGPGFGTITDDSSRK